MRIQNAIGRNQVPQLPILRSGDFVAPGTGTGTVTPSADVLHFIPIFVRNPMTADRIGIEVTTGGDAGSVCRLGIYRDNGQIYPGTLLVDAGTVSTAGIAALTITISQALSTGCWWLAAATQTASANPQYRTSTGQPYTIPSGSLSATGHSGRSQTGVTGALPATAAPTTVVANCPRPQLRLA